MQQLVIDGVWTNDKIFMVIVTFDAIHMMNTLRPHKPTSEHLVRNSHMVSAPLTIHYRHMVTRMMQCAGSSFFHSDFQLGK